MGLSNSSNCTLTCYDVNPSHGLYGFARTSSAFWIHSDNSILNETICLFSKPRLFSNLLI